MRKDQIQAGKTYENGKGLKRTVRAILFIDSPGNEEASYTFLNGKYPGLSTSTSLESFARWAKSEVKE
jgi:hypothetical protein